MHGPLALLGVRCAGLGWLGTHFPAKCLLRVKLISVVIQIRPTVPDKPLWDIGDLLEPLELLTHNFFEPIISSSSQKACSTWIATGRSRSKQRPRGQDSCRTGPRLE
jgi:hypothetical protein